LISRGEGLGTGKLGGV